MSENDSSPAPRTDFEALLSGALEGNEASISAFFEALLEGPLFVPERFQQYPMTDAPVYPDPFLNTLAVREADRVVVPAFSSPELIQEWSGNELGYRALSGLELFRLLPEEWWITFNPGSPFGKDLSPWEIQQLKLGPESIPAVVAENLADRPQPESVQLRYPEENELRNLRVAMVSTASLVPQIDRLYLMQECGVSEQEDDVQKVLVGVQLKEGVDADRQNEIVETLKRVGEPELIGIADLKVIAASDPSDLQLAIFREAPVIYEREGYQKGFLAKLKDLLLQ